MAEHGQTLEIDIVSDVVCPWCIVGWRQLEQALAGLGVGAFVRWHPFELNPAMPPEGQNLREHIAEKYGSTPAQSDQARARLTALGAELGFTFAFTEESRIYNTFDAHRLLGWAATQNRQHPLKLALFEAYFVEGRDIGDAEVLADIADGVGLDASVIGRLLSSDSDAESIRERDAKAREMGVNSVPTYIVAGKHAVPGAQPPELWGKVIREITEAIEA